ncbi:MAG: hypothetical protein K2O31_07330 [Clostridia bacterium]|nr:hypothetical protein [Clostridia bacterium]
MPINDEYMTYDFRKHRYVLTEKAVLEEVGINLNDITGGNVTDKNLFLKRVSSDVYSYLLEGSRSPDYIEYILAVDTDLRATVQDMLVAQAEYTLLNGAISMFAGINLAKGTAVDIYKLRDERKVAEQVQSEANKILSQYGFCLKYAGTLPAISPSVKHKGY